MSSIFGSCARCVYKEVEIFVKSHFDEHSFGAGGRDLLVLLEFEEIAQRLHHCANRGHAPCSAQHFQASRLVEVGVGVVSGKAEYPLQF